MKQSIPNQQEHAPRHADDYNELEKKGSGTSRQGPSDYEKKSSPPGKSIPNYQESHPGHKDDGTFGEHHGEGGTRNIRRKVGPHDKLVKRGRS